MANRSFLKALTFNIHGLKENVEILNYYPFWEET